MLLMKIADHFQELWSPSFGAPRGSLRDFIADAAYVDEREIVQYLLAGHDLFSVMGSSEDVLGSGETIMGGATPSTRMENGCGEEISGSM